MRQDPLDGGVVERQDQMVGGSDEPPFSILRVVRSSVYFAAARAVTQAMEDA